MLLASGSIRRLAVVLLCGTLCLAQDPRGAIVGRVTDPSGAVMAGAEVRAVNTETGVATATRTNDAGNFILPNLLPGTYTASIERAGFKRFVREGIEVRVGERLTLDVALDVGAVTESVTVSSQAPLLETT